MIRALVLAALFTAGVQGGAQDPGDEGPLGNDVFLPTSQIAASALSQGDEALSKNDRGGAIESWRRALAESADGECVPAPRGSESIEAAVLRRLRSAGDDVRAAWRARFETLADAALAASRFEASILARVEREFPLTHGSARSALALSDLAHEAGDPIAASTWLGRARAHATPEDGEIGRAIERRSTAASPAADDSGEIWRTASTLELETRIALTVEPTSSGDVEPGVAFLAGGRACVQGSDALHVIGPDGIAHGLSLSALARGRGWSWPPPFAAEGERWPLLPACDGDRAVLVAGRAAGTRGNALLCVEAIRGLSEPNVVWGYSGAEFQGESAGSRSLAELLGPGLWEFQPGPAIAGGTLLVQARQWIADGEELAPRVDESAVRAWILALDLANGLPRWTRLLAIGANAKARLQGPRGRARPPEPVAVDAGRAFVGTGIGAGVLLDACDGRVVASIECRRAPERARRWQPSRPVFAGPASIVWAPSDSDRLYFLARSNGGAPFGAPPAEIGGDETLLGADERRVVVACRQDSLAAVALLVPATGSRAYSAPLAPGGSFSGAGLVSRSRAILAGDRAVQLLDLDRELSLLQSVDLPGREASPRGGIAAQGERVIVAGEQAVWILRAR